MLKIGFSTTNGLISRAIRWVTRSRVSHTFVVYYDETLGREMVLHADLKGVETIPMSRFQESNTVVYICEPELTPYQRAHALLYLSKWLGSQYDFAGLFGNLWVLFGRWLKLKIRNPWGSSKAVFCSEAIVRALQEVNYPAVADLDPEATNPDDLYEALV